MPHMHALCFDMMGLHNLFPHRQRPLSTYYEGLFHGNNSYMFGNQLDLGNPRAVPGPPNVGPWDDIMCWFPQAGERAVPLDQGGSFGVKKFHEANSFGRNFLIRQSPHHATSHSTTPHHTTPYHTTPHAHHASPNKPHLRPDGWLQLLSGWWGR